jgi:uncharacterized protein
LRENSITFSSAGHTLAATLTVPDGEGPFPAALLVPGSGPVDRDSDHRRLPLGITRELARALARTGLASLRYDKRGVGASDGDWRVAGLSDNIDDAAAALTVLQGRDEVAADRVAVVGHSEGALIAAAVAADHPDVAGVVLLSGSATPGEELLIWQAEQIAPTLPGPLRAILRLLRIDLVAQVRKNHRKIKATTADVARIGGARLNARWTREFMALDPREDLRRLAMPVLAITGSKDLQARPGDLPVIAATVPGPVETYLAPDVTHILRRQPGEPSLSHYKKEVRLPLDADVLGRVTGWLVGVLVTGDEAARPA